MSNIKIKSIKEIKSKLTKEQIMFFCDKAKSAMDAYELLVEIKENCSDPLLVEEIFGGYIFVTYRSIFGKNKLNNNKAVVRIDYKIFLTEPLKMESFEFKYKSLAEYEEFHKFVIGLVNQVYSHTDLNSEYKEIKTEAVKSRKITKKIERRICFDDIEIAVNLLATAHSNFENAIKDGGSDYYYTEYRDNGWVSFGYKN